MEKEYTYTFEEFKQGVVKEKHKGVAHDQLQFVSNFIDSKQLDFVKKNLECIIQDSDEGRISIKSGSAEYKFLATYDVNGMPKMRRLIGDSFLKAKFEGLHEEVVKEVNEDTMLAVLKKIWSKHRPGKKPATSADEGRENYCKGLLCMQAGLYLNTRQIKRNVEIALFDGNDDLYKVKCGNGNDKVLATFDKKGNPKVLHFVGQEYSLASEVDTYIYECKEINKVSIGKLMVKVCGNEGTDDDENSAFVRKLLQSLLTHFENEKDKAWKDNEVTIYDKKLNSLIMKAGKGHKATVVSLDGQGEIFIS
ncbi:uncharacterized protein LOC128553281 [Mercenaria mercenaria]|uniref:uncharacterized protein LOC128553281 n=1 Tax=Mercenaria mercenaria TaxID=6596 RepID=UPI00234F2A17|nr:uncharacterized protein LOC128553281 [Mercenaria mercenaria]